MAKEKRLIDANALYNEIEQEYDLYYGEIVTNPRRFAEMVEDTPTVKAVPVDEILRVIAGHSNYHGDNILSALICIAEGKKVNPVRPLEKADAVEVVRCKDCQHWRRNHIAGIPSGICIYGKPRRMKPDDFCSYGERRVGE